MSKILLIYPPLYSLLGWRFAGFPIGLCYIAALLEKNNFDVTVYNADFKGSGKIAQGCYHHKMTAAYDNYLKILNDDDHPAWKDIEMKIAQQSPDLVAISVLTPAYSSALKVAKIAKKIDENIPVVFGGVHPTVLPEESIKNGNVDLVVRGEGEYTFLDIAQNINS